MIIHNQALVLPRQIVLADILNLYHWSDAEAFGIRLCNRINFVNRYLSVLSVVTQKQPSKTNTLTD